MGHDLKFYEDIEIGNYAFRDDAIDEKEVYSCKLRVAFDFAVSTGYSHLKDLDEILREYGVDP